MQYMMGVVLLVQLLGIPSHNQPEVVESCRPFKDRRSRYIVRDFQP